MLLNRQLKNQQLDETIKTIHYESKKRYGATKIPKVLELKGIYASLKRVQRTIKDGWTYLACVMDFHNKKIIDYAYSKNITAELAVKAVENACINVKQTTGIILHSDLGTQYTSRLFEDSLRNKNMLHSYSRKGCPYDNACIESFHSLLKKEEIHHHKYFDFKMASQAIFEYIESWYNRKRIHSSLNYMTPQAFEDAAKAAA